MTLLPPVTQPVSQRSTIIEVKRQITGSKVDVLVTAIRQPVVLRNGRKTIQDFLSREIVLS
jgi:hypothetical protein